MGIVGTLDYDALDSALQRGVRVSTVTLGSPELREYKRAVMLHAIHGTHREYVPVVIAIARNGIGYFGVKPELKHFTYTALGETLLQLLALTPLLQRPPLHRPGERPHETEQRLLNTLSALYEIAADELIVRHVLRAPLDEEYGDKREGLDAVIVEKGGAHNRFLRTLSNDIVALVEEHMARHARAQKEGESCVEPFLEIAHEPEAHVRSLQVAMATFTGRSVQEYGF